MIFWQSYALILPQPTNAVEESILFLSDRRVFNFDRRKLSKPVSKERRVRTRRKEDLSKISK